ncbi:hypothetical protein ACTQ41_03315 [Bacillota bacterium LCP21S3_D8]
MRGILQKITAAMTCALLLGMAAGCPGTVLAVSAAETGMETTVIDTEAAVTGNAAAESAIASEAAGTMDLAEDQAALESYLLQLQAVIEQQTALIGATREQTARNALATQTRSTTWKGSVLNRYNGVNRGPSGKETYYNLNMNKIVDAMKRLGVNSEYWVRNDGVKMYGDYIMCAADLSVYPRGSIVETSLGTGIVCDTGVFVKSTGIALDIATAW